jgi:bifunctional DNA-binding transcriptional regulator/antitoxin component of YhaV-PrlF toxin-antitoxin module
MAGRKSATRIVQPLRGGQITIPVEFRRRLGITEDSVLQVTLVDHELRIRPLEVTETARGSQWFKELYDLFAPVREETKHYSEEEINAEIDEALKEVRAEHDAHRR